jgi:threonine synthase
VKFISTNQQSPSVSFFEAMRTGLSPDGGLYMPDQIPGLSDKFWSSLQSLSFHEIAFEMAKPFLNNELSEQRLRSVIEDAFDFPLNMVSFSENQHVLELFHGPTLAFKDFGARFMARLFRNRHRKSRRK